MWNLETAKSRLSALVADALAGRPPHVSRRGKPAVVMLSEADYSAFKQAARQERGRFAEHLLDFLAEAQRNPLPRAEACPRDVAL